jgi:C4-dicarboxylate-binding protein DctP
MFEIARNRFDWRLAVAVTVISGLVAAPAPSAFASDDIPPLRIRATNSYPQDQPAGRAMDFFAKRVSELSNGRMTVQVFHAGRLYTEDRSIQAVLDGTVDMGMASASNYGPFTRAFAVIETPFLLDRKQFREVIIRGKLGTEVKKLAERNNLRPMMFLETGGHRVVGGNGKIRVPEDVRGMKIRTAQSPVILEFYRAIGANPIVVPWGETYLALANRTVDGLDAVMASWPAGRLWEVTKHVTTINWAPIATVTSVSTKWWKARTPRQREILEQAAREAEAYSMKAEDDNEQPLRQLLNKNGVTIYDPTPAERKAWRTIGQTVWPRMPGVDQDLLKRIHEAAQKIQ